MGGRLDLIRFESAVFGGIEKVEPLKKKGKKSCCYFFLSFFFPFPVSPPPPFFISFLFLLRILLHITFSAYKNRNAAVRIQVFFPFNSLLLFLGLFLRRLHLGLRLFRFPLCARLRARLVLRRPLPPEQRRDRRLLRVGLPSRVPEARLRDRLMRRRRADEQSR